MASRIASVPNAVKSEAKKRLLVTDGDDATRCSMVMKSCAAWSRSTWAHRVLHGPHERQRVHGGPDGQNLARVHPLVLPPVLREVLAERNVDRGRLLAEEARIGHIRDHADDLPRLRLGDRAVAGRADRDPDRLRRAASWPGKWRSANVLLMTATHGADATSRSCDHPAAQQPDPERVERLRVDLVEIGLRLLARLGDGPPDDREGMRPHVHRQAADDAGARHAGQRAHALQQLVVEDAPTAASPGSCPAASCRSTSCLRAGCRPSAAASCRSRADRCCSRRKPRIMRPAPTSSTIDSATSATSSSAPCRAAPAARPARAFLEDLVEIGA